MLPDQYSIGQAATLRIYPTTRFKAGMLSVLSVLEITRESACLAPLMLSVLRRGTEKYPTLADINRRLDYLYGTGFSVRSSYRGNLLILGFSAELLDASYLPDGAEDLMDAVLELMQQILFHPVLDADGLLSAKYVESEKELQCDAIRSVKNSPRAYAIDRCSQIFLDVEPCGCPFYGTEEETRAVTREQLTAYWRQWIADLKPDCFYIGPADAKTVCRKVERAFGNCHGNTWELSGTARCTAPGRGIRECGTLPVSQSQLIIGLRGAVGINSPDMFAAAVLNEMLGASPVSRLFVYVREKMSLCYSCSSSYSPFLGTVLISCGLKTENRARAEEEIFRQLRALANGDFTEAEQTAAIRSLDNAYRQLEDNPGELENYFYGRALMGNTLSPEDCRRGFAAVTAADIIRAARALTVDTVYFLEGTLADDTEREDDDESAEI